MHGVITVQVGRASIPWLCSRTTRLLKHEDRCPKQDQSQIYEYLLEYISTTSHGLHLSYAVSLQIIQAQIAPATTGS